MAQEQRIIKGFNTEAGLGIYDYDSLANKPNIEGMIQNALEEFVPPVDNTLMNDGQAADAKVTGEAISRLELKIGSDSVSEQIEQAEQRVSERIEQAIDAIPPNHPLTFEGAVEATYNGSAPIAVAIPIIDDSLEVEGNAADAKATGEAIGAVLKKMDEEIGSATKTYVDEKFDNIEIPEIPEFSGFIAQPEAPTQYNVLWIDTDDESIDSEIGNIEQIDAWTLQGNLPSYFASKEFVKKEIADAQLDDKEVDLSSYYTKNEVDSKIENIQLKEGPQGEPGKPFVYEDFTEEQLKSLQGPKGDAFEYNDFTQEQLESLRGAQGENGVGVVSVEQTTQSSASGGVNTFTVHLSDGNSASFNVYNGQKGGDGVGISSIQQTSTSGADSGINTITITLNNGQTQTFNVKNGSKGSTGANATINGVNALTLNTSGGITKTQSGSTMTIGANLTNLLASGPLILKEGTNYHYGDTLPAAGTAGRIFFKKVI